jgi:hypothetical protein
VRPAELVALAQAEGISLRAAPRHIIVTPMARLTPELRAALLAAKPAVLRLLRRRGLIAEADPRRCAGCGRDGDTFTLMVVIAPAAHLCRRCHSARVRDARQPGRAFMRGATEVG